MSEVSEGSKPEEERGEKPKYPTGIYFILGFTYCERFCFYGIQVILTIYLRHRFEYSENKVTVIYHTFMVLTEFLPLLGAIIADSWLGKFWAIFYFCILYAAGALLLSAGSASVELMNLRVISLVALFTISVGSGGLKPCSSAIGGDQFQEQQVEQREFYFSMLYLMTNCGSLMSMFLTPILREDVQCFGELSCYPLAFGVSAILITSGFLLFVSGMPFYKLIPPEGSTLMGVIACISHALYRKVRNREEKRQHWLEFADDKYDKTMIKDIQTLLHILWIFLPVPFFWTLYEQFGSKWVLQAMKMEGETSGIYIKPDQLQVVNPILIIIMIPIFEYGIYPLLEKFNLLTRSLQRMIVGGVLAVLSFTVAGFVSLAIEASDPSMPKPGLAELTVVNNAPCSFNIRGSENAPLESFNSLTFLEVPVKYNSWIFSPNGCSAKHNKTYNFTVSGSINSMMVTLQGGNLQMQLTDDSKKRSEIRQPKIRLFYSLESERAGYFQLKGSSTIPIKPSNKTSKHGITEYVTVLPGKYDIYTSYNVTAYESVPIGKVSLRSGGSYIVAVYKNSTEKITNVFTTNMVDPNSIHILLLLIQYVVITAAEIMLSITGMQFSYAQAPHSMKTVALAGWSLTAAVGNLIIVFIQEITFFEKQSVEFFVFAILMSLDVAVFAIMAHYYVYTDK